MRRGLIAWDETEVPLIALEERVRRLQAAVAAAGQDAILLYTNFIRSAAVSYVTGFSPYWADGLLLVARAGEPVFATTLSKRVGSWIQTVKPIGGLVNSPAPGKILGEKLAASGARHVAVLELDAFPGGLYDEISAALPGVHITDGTELFAKARTLDVVERRLLSRANAIAKSALEFLKMTAAPNVGIAVGAVEEAARMQGAEEAYIAIAPDIDADGRFLRLSGPRPLGARFAIRATVAYRGSWVRRIQTYSRDATDERVIERANTCFETLLSHIDGQRPLSAQILSAVEELPGAERVRWLAETAVGSRPLAVTASSHDPNAVRPAPAFVLSLRLTLGGVPWHGAGLVLP